MRYDYEEWLSKFDRYTAKTSDDCYTPAPVFDTVAEWVIKEYHIPDSVRLVRPFYPGGDYQQEDYTNGIVIDNPPFSIISKICRWYQEHKIKFFLFAPSQTLFSNTTHGICYIATGSAVTFENGAIVRISFVTNMDKYLIRSAPDLTKRIEDVQQSHTKPLPKYQYPDCVISPSNVMRLSIHGVDFRVKPKEALFIRALDAQKREKKTIYGGGYLLNSDAAARRAAADTQAELNKERNEQHRRREQKAPAIYWQLSERERALIAEMDKEGGSDDRD